MRWRRMERREWVKCEDIKRKRQEGRGETVEKERGQKPLRSGGGCDAGGRRGRSRDDRGSGKRREDLSSRRLTPF